MAAGIPYEEAHKRYHPGGMPTLRTDDSSVDELLKGYHPDHGPNAHVALSVGVSRGELCQPDLARALQANALIDDVDIAGAQVMSTDVLIIGGGGGGCAAALTAAKKGARVILATKLRLGDSNTVMAEGGIQAAIGEDDSPQLHFEDTLRAGHFCGKPELVAQMVMDGPDVIRWLIQLGMMFDQEDSQLIGGNLVRKARRRVGRAHSFVSGLHRTGDDAGAARSGGARTRHRGLESLPYC